LYNIFGIVHIEDPPSKDESLCILHEARKSGLRSRQEISQNFSTLKNSCKSRINSEIQQLKLEQLALSMASPRVQREEKPIEGDRSPIVEVTSSAFKER